MKKILFLLPLLLTACTANQKIFYNTSDISVVETKTIPIIVDIRVLEDNRRALNENDILFEHPRQTKVNGKQTCINAEKHYKKEPVVSQITKLLVDHFNKVKLFQLALYDQNNQSNYYLTGNLNSFYGEQEYSTGAAIGSQFGLIGALATAGIKTPGIIRIEIADIQLYRKDGTLIKDLGTFYKEYNEDFKADGYCWCMYWNTNEKLREFNAQLAEKIRNDLSGIRFQE